MSELLSQEERAQLASAFALFPSPIPTRAISNGETMPGPQTPQQRAVEARIKALAGDLARKHGMSRRRFLRTASGMAAAFVAMNEVYGPVFRVSRAEAQTPDMAAERARRLANQFVFDDHTHFLRPDAAPDSALRSFVGLRQAIQKSGFNPAMANEEQSWDKLMFPNYVKEIYLDSDTKVAIISGAPSQVKGDWFLTNDMKAEARAKVNGFAGSTRLLSQAIFDPTEAGWLDEIDRCVEQLKPDSWKAYTIGDNTHKDKAKAWRMDDEKLVYKAYEKFDKAGIRIVAVHKGLFPPALEKDFPQLTVGARVDDIGKAAKDWPQLKFMVYHAGFRNTAGPSLTPDQLLAEFERTGRIDWVTDVAEIPAKYGVNNVYADLGATFATVCVANPRIAAALVAQLVKGLGADRVVWGTDSLWYGSPQWQIEALRRLEVPEDMQKKHGFAPLGEADGIVKSAILGYNSARVYGMRLADAGKPYASDRLAALKMDYERAGPQRSNRAYGYVLKDGGLG